VNVLGRGTDIQRAIKMYGRIGGVFDPQTLKTGFVVDPSQPATARSMVSLFMEDMLGTTEGILEDVFYLPSKAIRTTVGFISAHKILIVLLVFSIFVNMFLSVISTGEYWHHRHAEKFMHKAGVQPNKSMVRMVSLKDIDDLVTKGLIGVNVSDNGVWYCLQFASLRDIATTNLSRFMRSMISQIQITTMPRNTWLLQPAKKPLT
jgi:hypothetical protein